MQLLEKLKEEANSEQAVALSASIEKQIAELHIFFAENLLKFFSKSFRIVFAFMANFAFGRVEILYVVSSTCCA